MITVTAMIGGKSRNGHAESHAITDVVCRQMASRMGFVSRRINSFTTSRFMAQNDSRNRAAAKNCDFTNRVVGRSGSRPRSVAMVYVVSKTFGI
jgi:hypothetical protein